MLETKVSLQGVKRNEWLNLRKTGLGGSDAGAVCGLNPYSSPLQVFYDKTSEEVQDKDRDRKSTRLNSSHMSESRMPSSA